MASEYHVKVVPEVDQDVWDAMVDRLASELTQRLEQVITETTKPNA